MRREDAPNRVQIKVAVIEQRIACELLQADEAEPRGLAEGSHPGHARIVQEDEGQLRRVRLEELACTLDRLWPVRQALEIGTQRDRLIKRDRRRHTLSGFRRRDRLPWRASGWRRRSRG